MSRPRVIAAIALVAGVIALAVASVNGARQTTYGFGAYYTAGFAFTDGVPVADLYDEPTFLTQVQRHYPDMIEFWGPTPPTALFFYAPLSFLDAASARWWWVMLSALALLGALLLAARLSSAPAVAVAASVLALVGQPTHECQRLGQAYAFVLLGLVLVWWGLERSRPRLSGGAMAALAIFKLSAWPLWPYLALKRQWTPLLWAAATTVAGAGISVAVMGPAAWGAFFEALAEARTRPSLMVTAYPAVPGLVRRLTTPHPRWNQDPLFELPGVADVLVPVLVLALVGVTLWRVRALPLRESLSGLIALGLITSPLTMDYHYVLAFVPLLCTGEMVWHHRWRPGGAAWAVAAFLIAAPLPPGVYPKLFGALVLWGISLGGRHFAERGGSRRLVSPGRSG